MSAVDSASEEFRVASDERAAVERPADRGGTPSAAMLVAIVALQLLWLGGFLYAAYRFLSY